MGSTSVDVFLRLHDGLTGKSARAATAMNRLTNKASRMGRAFATMHSALYGQAWKRGYGGAMGPNERSARRMGQGAHNILGGRKLDQGLRKQYQSLNRHQGRMDNLQRRAERSERRASRGGAGYASLRAGAAGGLTGRLSGGIGYGPGVLGTAAGGAAAYSMLKRYSNFQSTELMARTIGKRTGQSKRGMDALIKQSRQLGEDTIFEPQDILEGGLQYLKAGRSTGAAMKAIRPSLNLSALSGQIVKKTSDQVLNIMAQGGIDPDKVGETANALYKSFIHSKAELPELATAASYSMMDLRSAGLGTDASFASLSALSEGGQVGSRGGRALAMTMSQFGKMEFMKKKAKVLKEIGLELNQYFDKGRLKSQEHYVKLLERMGEIHKDDARVLSQLFPQNSKRAMQALLTMLPTFKRVLSEIKKDDGNIIAEDAKVKFKGIEGAWKQMSARWSEAGIKFGESAAGKFVEDSIRGLGDGIKSLGDAFSLGTFWEELFDPKLLTLRIAKMTSGLMTALMEAIRGLLKGSLNAIGEALYAGRLGDKYFGKSITPGRNEMLEKMNARIYGRQVEIRNRANAKEWNKLGLGRNYNPNDWSVGGTSAPAVLNGIRPSNVPPPMQRPGPGGDVDLSNAFGNIRTALNSGGTQIQGAGAGAADQVRAAGANLAAAMNAASAAIRSSAAGVSAAVAVGNQVSTGSAGAMVD